MKITVKRLARVAVLLSFLPTYASAETLQEAVQNVVQRHPDVRSAAHNRLARDKEVVQARSGYYPQLNVEAGAGYDDVKKPIDDELSPWEARISLRQNLFAGFSTMNEVERQKARVKSQAFLTQSSAENTALETIKTYLEVLKNQEYKALADENLILHERIGDQIGLRSESGVGRGADQSQIQSRLGLARSNVIVTEQNLIDAQTNYHALLGHEPVNLSVPQSVVELLPKSLSDAEQRAIADHPTLKSAIADLKARFKQDEVAKSTFWPIVDFEIDKIFEDETSYSYDEREDLRLFLRLRYNLFNGWKDKARKEETEELIREAIEIKNHTFRQVIESIRLSWQAFQSANRRIAYLKERLQYSASTANAYTQQWNINERTLLDVLDAEAERIDAARQLVAAEFDGLYSHYRLLNGMGKLIPSLGLNLPDEGAVDEDDDYKDYKVDTSLVEKLFKQLV